MSKRAIAIAKEEFNSNTHFYAFDNDITYLYNENTYCCCQTFNEMNNILVESKTPRASTFRDIARFLILLYEEYDIRYVSIYEEREWTKILKHFRGVTEPKDPAQHYYDLKENLKELKRHAHYQE